MTWVCGFEVDWLCWFACQLFQWKKVATAHCSSLGLLLQDWGRAGDVAALGVCWHVPCQREENLVFQLLSLLLHPQLQRIKAHVSGDQPMTRCAVVCLTFGSAEAIRHTLTFKPNKQDGGPPLLMDEVCSHQKRRQYICFNYLSWLLNQERRVGKVVFSSPKCWKAIVASPGTYCRGRSVMWCVVNREELWQSLAIVQHCLLGAGSMLPPLDGAHIPDLWGCSSAH